MELQQSIAVQDNCLDILFHYSFLGSLLRDTAQNRNWVSQVQGRYELEGEYAKCLYSKHLVTLERKKYFSPFIKKVEELQWKICILHAGCFPFLLFPDKTSFFLSHSC